MPQRCQAPLLPATAHDPPEGLPAPGRGCRLLSGILVLVMTGLCLPRPSSSGPSAASLWVWPRAVPRSTAAPGTWPAGVAGPRPATHRRPEGPLQRLQNTAEGPGQTGRVSECDVVPVRPKYRGRRARASASRLWPSDAGRLGPHALSDGAQVPQAEAAGITWGPVRGVARTVLAGLALASLAALWRHGPRARPPPAGAAWTMGAVAGNTDRGTLPAPRRRPASLVPLMSFSAPGFAGSATRRPGPGPAHAAGVESGNGFAGPAVQRGGDGPHALADPGLGPAVAEEPHKPLVVVIAGPTGVGKSAVAMALIEGGDGCLVSADSVQVYRGLDVGSNKPSPAEQGRVPHHLIDVADAADPAWNASVWRARALETLRDVAPAPEEPEGEPAPTAAPSHPMARLCDAPVIVGGTMMWMQWLIHGVPDAPAPSPAAVARAAALIARPQAAEDWDAGAAVLAGYGGEFATRAAKLGRNDWYRLTRALEVAEEVARTDGPRVYQGVNKGALREWYDVRAFFLVPDDRLRHAARLDARCEGMVVRGLLQETGRLLCAGVLLPDTTPGRAIGYRQALDYLCRPDPRAGDEDALDAFLHEFLTSTRRYAKEQMKWFRKDREFMFVPVPIDADPAAAVAAAAEDIRRHCALGPAAFRARLRGPEDAALRAANQAQGQGMRVFQSDLQRLRRGSDVRRAVLAAGDEWTPRCQAALRERSAGASGG